MLLGHLDGYETNEVRSSDDDDHYSVSLLLVHIESRDTSVNDSGAAQHRADEYCDWVPLPCQSMSVLEYLEFC
jgi:hypothetical protein